MIKNKIVLTTLPTEGEFINWTTPPFFAPASVKYMPMSILSLASNTPPQYDVVILDPQLHGWTIQETADMISREDPEILGISAVTRRAYPLKELLRICDVPYKVVGGPHATHHSVSTLRWGADVVFVGQLADNEFRDWLQDRQCNIVINCSTGINTIAYPDRTLVDYQKYIYHGKVLFTADSRMPMFSSVGCPNGCNYCNVQSLSIQFKNSRTVMDEMKHLVGLGCHSVHILDDNFNVNRAHVSSILDEMDRERFVCEWSARGQVRMDYGLLPRMVEHGFKRIHVGIESFDDDTLTYFRKRQRLLHIDEFCDKMNTAGVDVLGYFIIGAPTETEEYRSGLAEMIRSRGIKYPYFNMLFPEPDTDYYRSLVADHTYPRDYWKEYLENPTPYYQIPYPYGEEKKRDVVDYITALTAEFSDDNNTK